MVLLFYFVGPTKSQKRGVVMETPDFSGVFPDLARAIASNLNMTLKIQSLKEENKGIYSRR